MSRSRAMAPPTLLMAPLLVVILVGALRAPWSSVATVDERTYLEMAMGIQETGLPLIDNGPVERFPPLQARWNLFRDGLMWGSMAPGFPYLSSSLLRAGGIRAVMRINLALLALLAVAVFLTGRELSSQTEVGVAAAYVALLTFPLWTSSFGFLPYSLAITGFAWALYCAARSLRLGRPGWALLAGLLAGLATTSQLLIFPMLVGLVAALAWNRLVLGLAAALGTVPALVGLAWLNHTRFGSWNPLSDGPCAWQGCPESGADPQSVEQMVVAALPVLGWLAAGTLVLWLLRRSPSHVRSVAVLLTLVPLAIFEPLREGILRYLQMGWRLLIDVGAWGEAENTTAAADGLGTFIGPHVVKAFLQGSPALVLVAAARLARPKLALLWLPVAALFSMLLLRASLPVDFALGHPFLNLRYLMPAAAPLAILATIGARRLPWGLHHLALAALVAALLRWSLWAGTDDLELWRRVLLLRGSLFVAVLLTVILTVALRSPALAWRRRATVLTAIAFGWGAGVSLGVDLAATVRLRDRVDILVGDLEPHLPERCALLGYPDQLDAPLTLLAERDVEYADLVEFEDWTRLRPVLLWWREQGRPIYGLLPPGQVAASPWSDLRFEPVDRDINLVEVVTDEATTQEE